MSLLFHIPAGSASSVRFLPIIRQESFLFCPESVKKMAVGHKFNQQMAHMLVFHSCLHMIMWATQCTPTYTSVHVHTVRREHAHMAPQNQREREKLNHIISSQIINDIIFSCSSYNIGLLDAGGNEEGVRLREAGGREREQRKLQKNRVCAVDERIQRTTKRMMEKRKCGDAERERLCQSL